MNYLIKLCLLYLISCGFCLAEIQDKIFQWQATEDRRLYAPFGRALPEIEIMTISGPQKLSELAENEIFMIAVRDPDCPVSRRYAGKLSDLSRQGLSILYLLTGPLATHSHAKRDMHRHGLNGVYLLDSDSQLSDWLGVNTSAEVYLFDKDQRLQYRGAIDDQYGIGFSRNQPNQHFLNKAWGELKDGQTVSLVATTAPGCIIRAAKPRHRSQEITWHNQIYPLIRDKCMSCHRPGQAGPFPLETYQQVFDRRQMVRFVLENKIMPPWSMAAASSLLTNSEKYLSDSDRNKIIDWIDAGAIKGMEDAKSPAHKWTKGWKYGQPDVVLTSPDIIDIPAEGEIKYQYISIPTDFDSDRYVKTVEVATLTPENTHHIILFVLPPVELIDKLMPGARKKTDFNRKELHQLALKGFFSGYIPGLPGVTYTNNRAKLLPRGWRIVLQIHHQSNGKKAKDQPSIGLQFLDAPPEKVITTLAAANIDLHIPAGKANHLETAQFKFERHGEIVGLYPHMHLRGKAFRYELLYPDGQKKILLDIPVYDPNWQQYYQFRQPVKIKSGSTLIASGWFDNSKGNFNNPDPETDVSFGLRTRDEMLIGYFDWVEGQ